MLVLYWYWHGTAGGAVQRGAVREGFVGGVVAQLQLRSEAVSVSVRTNVSPCLLSLCVLLCSALRVFFLSFFSFAWTCVICR